MSKIFVVESDPLCSCNNCNARDYNYNDSAKKVHTIFEIRIGRMVNRLCPDCLAELIGKATVALASDK